MKKVVSLLMIAVFMLSILPASVVLAEGDEVVSIATKEELSAVRQNLSGHYRLVADIAFEPSDFEEGGLFYNGGSGWQPIGVNVNSPFNGIFDGNGHTISGLTLTVNAASGSSAYLGLFNFSGTSALIRDFNLTNVNISLNGAKNVRIGAVVAQNQGIVENVHVSVNISVTNATNIVSVGGVVGRQTDRGTVLSCMVDSDIVAQGVTLRIGGLIGENVAGVISSCRVAGSVKGSALDKIYIGGLVGDASKVTKSTSTYNGSISDCSFVGKLDGFASNESFGGAICGYNDATLTGVYAEADMTITCDSYLTAGMLFGGRSASNTGTVSKAFATLNESIERIVGSGSTEGCTVLTVPYNENDVSTLLSRSGWEWDGERPLVTITELTAPTGSITIGSDVKSTWSTESDFSDLKPQSTVTISHGTDMAAYLVANTALTAAELDASDSWTAYSEPFSLTNDGTCMVYARLTDTDGYVSYINSAGFTIDTIPPTFSGIEDGAVYCEETTFSVNDLHLADVTVNGTAVDSYILPANNSPFTVVATDSVGNASSVTVTVNNGHRAQATDDPTAAVYCRHCGALIMSPKTTWTVTVEAETGGTATANDNEVGYGDPVTLTATPDDGYYFDHWIINGRKVGQTPYTLNIYQDTVVKAVFYQKVAQNTFIISFFSKDKRLIVALPADELHNESDLPDVPVRYGYVANGWDLSLSDPITSDMTVYPNYIKDTTATYSVEVVGGNASISEGAFETRVTLTPDNPSAFTAWTENGITISTTPNYTFYLTADRHITASAEDNAPAYGLSLNRVICEEMETVKYKMTVIGEVFVSDSWKVIERGIIYSNVSDLSDDDLVIGSDSVVKRTCTSYGAGQYMYTLNRIPQDVSLRVRGYAILKNDSGAFKTVYSEVAAASLA